LVLMSAIQAVRLEDTDHYKLLFALLDAIDAGEAATCGPQPDGVA
jgi:hypothetical protein